MEGGARTGRRPLLIGLVGGTAALAVASVAAKVGSALQDPTPSGLPALQLSADSASMSSLSVHLDDRLLSRRTSNMWLGPGLMTSTHSMAAVTWEEDASPQIRIRSRVKGRWTGWRLLPVTHDGPDPDSGEGLAVQGTQLVWTGDSDGIQLRLDGERPAGLTLVLLRPARLAADSSFATGVHVEPSTTGRARTAARRVAPGQVPTPTLLSRADWGADERWRTGSPRYNETIQQAHVHHTASGNDYTEADVPAIIRGFYRYHTGTLGWSDIGYNFLVDQFGRTWVGRAGGPGRPVRGAHTLGFNATSVGTSVIGNFDLVEPGAKVLQAVAAVAAWKLHPYGRDPEGTTHVDSEGSDKFRAGRVVALPVIDGHRDTNDTACPGQHLYDHLPGIRTRAQAIIALALTPPTVEVVTPPVLTGDPVIGETLTVTPGTFTPTTAVSTYTWLRDGVAIPGATTTTYHVDAADLGALLAAQVTTSAKGFASVTETLALASSVHTTTTISVRTQPQARKAVIHVRVSATGTDVAPTGSVTVTLHKLQQTVPLIDGSAAAHFTQLHAGQKRVTVSYPGSTDLDASQTTLTVVVDPRS